MQRDDSEKNEQKTLIDYFQEEDEIYPLATYSGQPEFAVLERDRYNVTNEEEIPSISLSTNLGVNELPPLPADHTQVYQDVHYELERWTVFRALPIMMQFDQKLH
jgi:hypothetical protein